MLCQNWIKNFWVIAEKKNNSELLKKKTLYEVQIEHCSTGQYVIFWNDGEAVTQTEMFFRPLKSEQTDQTPMPLRLWVTDGFGFLQRNTLFNLFNKLDDIISKQLWLFKSCKMSTPRHLRKLYYVIKSFVSKRCWYSEKLVRKISKTCGHCDGNPSKTNNNKGTVNQYCQNNDKLRNPNTFTKRKHELLPIKYYVYITVSPSRKVESELTTWYHKQSCLKLVIQLHMYEDGKNE